MAQDQARMTRTKRCMDSEFRVGLLDRVVEFTVELLVVLHLLITLL